MFDKVQSLSYVNSMEYIPFIFWQLLWTAHYVGGGKIYPGTGNYIENWLMIGVVVLFLTETGLSRSSKFIKYTVSILGLLSIIGFVGWCLGVGNRSACRHIRWTMSENLTHQEYLNTMYEYGCYKFYLLP